MPDTKPYWDLHVRKRKDLRKNAKVRKLTLILIKINQPRFYFTSLVHETLSKLFLYLLLSLQYEFSGLISYHIILK